MDGYASRIAASGRARGVVVGSLIALGWAYYGASMLPGGVRAVALAASIAVTGTLLVAAFALLRRVRSMPPSTPPEIAAGRRKWRWFWINLVGEIVLLNVAVGLLASPDLRIYWIAAISAVVGLHFLPMAVFFRVRSYWFVGIAMMIVATVTALAIARHPDRAAAITSAEAWANAIILWSSLAIGITPTRVGPAPAV